MNSNDVRVFKILKKAKLVTLTNFLLTIKDDGIKGVCKKIKVRCCGNENKKDLLAEKINKKNNIGTIIKYNNKVSVDIIVDEKINLEDVKKVINKCDVSKYVSFNYIVLVKKYSQTTKFKELNYSRLRDLFYDRAFLLVSNSKIETDDFFYCNKIEYNENLLLKVNELFSSLNGLKMLANYNEKNCVSVKTGTFFNFEGSNYYSGGAERYLIDLYDIFKNKNINMDIYQNATKPFFRKYNGINVIGMNIKNKPLVLNDEYNDLQTNHYINLTNGKSQLHIYSAFFEAYPNHISPSIGISHGIGWDNESNKNLDAQSFWESKKMIIESAKDCDSLVSVDTNTANWFQTVDYEIGNKKFSVIPNYVDINEFQPRKDFDKLNDKIIVVYPRRLYKPRGLYLALEAADKILSKNKNVEFHFVGKGFKQETDDIDTLIKKYPKNIKRYSKSPFDMHEVYKIADISLVPTLYSEGTSLSCLEAMASGNVVISTRIGGLSDLIINGYNGYLIEPNSDALYNTLVDVIENYEKQLIIKKRAVDVAKAFNKKIWIKKWIDEIDKFELKKESENIELVEFYVEDANSMSSEIIKLIKENLLEKKLVYIRSKKKIEVDNISANLIQLVDFDDEIVNIAQKVFVEKKIKKNVDRKEKIIIV